MKKFKIFFVLSLLCMVFTIIITPNTASATYTNFSIRAGWTYGEKSSPNLKVDDNQQGYVKWTSSSDNSPHLEWFRVVNSDSKAVGNESLFEYLESDFVPEDGTAKNYNYYLQARREHVINPATTVKGTWES